jgi:cation diffusion facilitator family transporter
MHTGTLDVHRHDHAFGIDERAGAERRTSYVVLLTAAMMVVEIAAGTAFQSMALLADGWHMATHAAALSVAVFAYRYARRHAHDARYTFGTGKVGALGGFASAVALAVIALFMLAESALRVASPVTIRFDEALPVAVLGLVVNLVCAFLLRERAPTAGTEPPSGGLAGRVHVHPHVHAHGHAHPHDHGPDHGHTDHNLRGAYLHVLADALTSVLAIAALLAGRQMGWVWMDPAIGIVGSLVIARWSLTLLRDTSRVLLDAEVATAERDEIRALVEADADNRVADLHVWRVGPRHLAAIVSLVTHTPREPSHYKRLLAADPDLAHVTVEVHRCPDETCGQPPA